MNERILELVNSSNEKFGFQWFLEDKIEFAELIVGECAKRCEELGKPELGLGLMKHFGVKE
jgi:hypothetical protein